MTMLSQANETTGELRPMRLLDLADAEASLVRLIEQQAEAAQETDTDPEEAAALQGALETALAAVQGDEAAKIDAIGEVLDELKAQEAAAESFRASADGIRARWMRRRDALKGGQKRLREYVGLCLDVAGQKAIKGRKHAARWQGQAPAVSIAAGMDACAVQLGFGRVSFSIKASPGMAGDVSALLFKHFGDSPFVEWEEDYEPDMAALKAACKDGVPEPLAGLVELGPDRHVRVS